MTLYIGRSELYDYELACDPERWQADIGFHSQFPVYRFYKEDFEEATGLKLAPGEIRKVKKITIEVE